MFKSKRKKGSKPGRSKAYYSLQDVRKHIVEGKVLIRSNATRDALNDFGWGTNDILDALKKLKLKHYHKTEPYRSNPTVKVDYYKARNLKGENVYTHFYINENDELVINSFKEI